MTRSDCLMGGHEKITPLYESSPEPNAIGWWSPNENRPMFNGLLLPAAAPHAKASSARGPPSPQRSANTHSTARPFSFAA